MIMAIIYRNVPRKKVNEMLLLGERLTADEAGSRADQQGVPRRALDDSTTNGRSARRQGAGRDAPGPRLDEQPEDLPYFTALEYLHTQFTVALGTEDAIEGAMAFFEKREPNWKGQ